MEMTLFGGERGWKTAEWTSSDDRVRGGKSVSTLQDSGSFASFTGHLDVTALGGAGFASQRTADDHKHWDLSQVDGIELVIDASRTDEKKYTFNVKDQLLPRDPDSGREQSTVSWEYDFVRAKDNAGSESKTQSIVIPWTDFKATYRGRPKDDAGLLNTADIRRFSIMVRSFFGAQEGDFSLAIVAINAVKSQDTLDSRSSVSSDMSPRSSLDSIRKEGSEGEPKPGFWKSLWCWMPKL